ncbi:MAG: rhomboid family intramembrane serine protease [Gemmatimonadota bacterium]|nr:rhomboid family intramembrane serine protease [Gemmatimonadota bacterium]
MSPWVSRLLIANVAMFVLQYLSPGLTEQLVLVPALLPVQPWTAITYMFLHGGFGHIFFNMLTLYFFGPRVEERLGGPHFLWLYFLSGMSGALLSWVFAPTTGVIGASGAIFGVMLAYARFWPHDRILIWGIVPVEARWLVGITTGIELFFIQPGARGGGIAHFAHLGGYAGAAAFLVWLHWRSPGKRFRTRVSKPVAAADSRRWSTIDRDTVHEVNRGELDRILDKINASGITSLTPAERTFLDHFSTK